MLLSKNIFITFFLGTGHVCNRWKSISSYRNQLSIFFRVDPFYIWGCPPQWGGNHWQKWNLQVFNSKLKKKSKTPKTKYQNNQKGVMCDIFNLTFTRFQLTRAESDAWYCGITSSSGSLGNLPSYSQVHVFFSSRWSHSSGLRQKMFGSKNQQRWQL